MGFGVWPNTAKRGFKRWRYLCLCLSVRSINAWLTFGRGRRC